MEIKDYVTYEVAKLLKEKGYDEPCDAYYQSTNANNNYLKICDGYSYHNQYSDRYSAPTLWDAQKWLREKHNISVEVHCGWDEKWYYNLWIIGSKTQIDSVEGHFIFYDTALNEGIKEALKLI